MALFTVLVGFTTTRPVIPDQHVSRVLIDAPDHRAASLAAAQWVASRPGVVMPTSTDVVDGPL